MYLIKNQHVGKSKIQKSKMIKLSRTSFIISFEGGYVGEISPDPFFWMPERILITKSKNQPEANSRFVNSFYHMHILLI